MEKLAFRQSHKLKVVGSNPTPATSFKVLFYALVAQLAEATVLEAVQCRFESHRGHHITKNACYLSAGVV